jgi:hypothetical protein
MEVSFKLNFDALFVGIYDVIITLLLNLPGLWGGLICLEYKGLNIYGVLDGGNSMGSRIR